MKEFYRTKEMVVKPRLVKDPINGEGYIYKLHGKDKYMSKEEFELYFEEVK